jgi:hypothetical protein
MKKFVCCCVSAATNDRQAEVDNFGRYTVFLLNLTMMFVGLTPRPRGATKAIYETVH